MSVKHNDFIVNFFIKLFVPSCAAFHTDFEQRKVGSKGEVGSKREGWREGEGEGRKREG